MPDAYHGRLPRLAEDAYVGYKHIHLVATTLDRRRIFASRQAVDPLIQMLRDTCVEYACECIVYVFMPDHVHMLIHGLTDASNGLACHNHWKGEGGNMLDDMFNCGNVWQPRSDDHVYRASEYAHRALGKTINYILQNPVRAGIVDHWSEYAYSGSLIGPCDIRHPYWWSWFCDDVAGPL